MPLISDEVLINAPINTIFKRMCTMDFEKVINSQFKFYVTFENDRLVKYHIKCGESITYYEKILIPEKYTIFSNRLPKPPFNYSFFFFSLHEHESSTLLKYIQDFELQESEKSNESKMFDYFKVTGATVLSSIKEYFSS